MIPNSRNKDKYSTNEKIIGKWIDGKTLYRKVVKATAPVVEKDGTFAISRVKIADNIDFAILEIAFITNDSNQTQYFPYITNSGNIIKAFVDYTKEVYITHNIKDYSSKEITLIVKYTKK